MLKGGRLEGIRVGATRYVRASSFNALLNKWDDQVATVRKQLERNARDREIIFYAPLMATLGMKSTIPADRKLIGAILGTISRETYDRDQILLSAIVHRQSTGATSAGPGFFDLAGDLGLKFKSDKTFLAEEVNKVWRPYNAA